MSINAISSVSLYEYYYTINKNEEKKKESPLADEMRKYGLTPTNDEALNAAMLQRAKQTASSSDDEEQQIPYSDRPWADLMYQLGLTFNPDPKDDIDDIKEELEKLTQGMNDKELAKEVKDLEDYVENLYLSFKENYSTTFDTSSTLSAQLNNLSMLNQANFY